MKSTSEEPHIPSKVNPTQRPRSTTKDEKLTKHRLLSTDFQKLVQFDQMISLALPNLDPFDLPRTQPSSSISLSSFSSIQPLPEQKSLIQDFIIDPQKSRKGKIQSAFTETKHKFDLISSKEDPEDQSNLESRLKLYNSSIQVNPKSLQQIDFLKKIPLTTSLIERQKILKSSQSLSQSTNQSNFSFLNKKTLIESILEQDPAVEQNIDLQDKVKAIKVMSKYNSNWEKLKKKLNNKKICLDSLKQFWRNLKFCMKMEVRSVKERDDGFDEVKWMDIAKKKIKSNQGKSLKFRVDAKPKEERVDVLALMANIENCRDKGIESETCLKLTGCSAFRAFPRNEKKLQECCVNRFGVRCEC